MRKMWLAVASLAVVAACAGPSETGDDGPSSTSPVASSTTVNPEEPSVESPTPDQSAAIEAAIADLVTRIQVGDEDITVVEAIAVQWSDGSLGCPEEGHFYTQAIVNGSRVLLEAEGRIYDYHAGSSGNVVFCASDADDGGYESTPPLRP